MNPEPQDYRPRWRMMETHHVDICNGNNIAAAILSFFDSVHRSRQEERIMGRAADDWQEFAVNYAQRVIVLKASDKKVSQSIQQLVDLGLLIPHPANASAKANFRPARFRLDAALLNRREAEWLLERVSEQSPRIYLAKPSNSRPKIYQLPVGNSTNEPSVDLPTTRRQIYGQDQEAVEEESESTTTTATEAASGLSSSLIDSSLQKKAQAALQDFMNKRPTTAQCGQLANLWQQYGEAAVEEAIAIAAAQDVSTLKYVVGILENKAKERADAKANGRAPERKYFTAPEPEPELTPEEKAKRLAMLAQFRSEHARKATP